MKKQIMSIAAIAAIFTTGAMAFDMESNGTIINRIYLDTAATPTQVKLLASYTGGVEANTTIQLSSDRRGDALIYPAFRSGDGWSTEISVRNTKDVAIIAKAVLYAKSDSRELGDFNLYLSPHDVAKFTIENSHVTSNDGSIASEVIDPRAGVLSDEAKFADTVKFDMLMGKMKEEDKESGYVVIYSMIEQTPISPVNKIKDNAVYHNNHQALFQDYRKMLDICREIDHNASTPANWRETFTRSPIAVTVDNGTAINSNYQFLAPNLDANCTVNYASEFQKPGWKLQSDVNFTTPSADALFGEVTISHAGDKRSLLLGATALSNYTTDAQIMLWAEGEYAAIQDRNIEDANSTTLSKYDTAKVILDANSFVIDNAYFTFDKNAGLDKTNDYAFLLTQPMKRAIVMAGDTSFYLNPTPSTDYWGTFTLDKKPWTEDEGTLGEADLGFIPLTSPLDVAAPEAEPFRQELATFTFQEMVDDLTGVDTYGFKDGTVAGYIDMKVNQIRGGLPAIVSQMSSNIIDGEAQINWIYSATSVND